ncbi:serine hydrolase domain-containing protein [Fodinicola feengrottensis]|uniref:Beta-lactamase-related domain-containing protein n=1 Tax=Fodinicola feengrottensis TaxID=435914 RepID=A0ABN2HE73_9ACTN|nr:serine hydrolase domain-containing protein [Fodinicola feengrottensis]
MLDAAAAVLDAAVASRPPVFPSAVLVVARDGEPLLRHAVGDAVRFKVGGDLLPPQDRVPARTDTIYDLASVTKLFTAVVAVRMTERGLLDLAAPVVEYVPAFGTPAITVRMLLTHTSGLEPDLPLWRDWGSRQERLEAVLTRPPVNPPGGGHLYSDLNMITLGVVLEAVTGRRLDELVRDCVTGPLAMASTGFNPPAAVQDRVAATEDESYAGRGMVRGEVHDESSWALGGVSGHAGLFSTADDLATFGRAIVEGGGGILSEESARMLTVGGGEHGLGFELAAHRYMGALADTGAYGHTGFTGTSLVVDPASRAVVVLLTNRVHPDRRGPSVNPVRAAVGDIVAGALQR